MTSNRSSWALIIHVLQKEDSSNRMSEAANKETMMITVNDEHRMMAVELAKRQLIQMTQAVRRNDLETYQRLDF